MTITGISNSGGGTSRPTYWSEQTGLVEVPLPNPFPGLPRGLIRDISSGGVAVGEVVIEGVANSSMGRRAAMMYSPAMGRVDLPMPADIESAIARRISRDGTIVSGVCVTFTDEQYPFRWTAAAGTQIDRTFPQRGSSLPVYIIRDFSDDGRLVFVESFFAAPGPPGALVGRALVWREGEGFLTMPFPPSFDGFEYSVTMEPVMVDDDGRRVLAEGLNGNVSGLDREYIYETPESIPVLATEFFESKGLDLSAWTSFETLTMSRDGTAFAGTGLIGTDGFVWAIFIPPDCPADLDFDGVLTPGDLTVWLGRYNAGHTDADQNFDASVRPNDFSSFIRNYNRGCN